MAASWPTKKDTSDGFEPTLTAGPGVLRPARKSLRLDGVLETSLLSPQIHRFLLAWSTLNNVVGTSRIEGNPLDIKEAKRVLVEGQADTPDEQEVLRLDRQYRRIHETASWDRLEIDHIVDLHGEIFEGILGPDDRPGALKVEQNYIKNHATQRVVFEPTPPDRTEAELESLLGWYYGDGQRWDPAVAAGVFFVEFQSIHPFADGNGRVGRLLNQRLLKEAGFKNVVLTPFDLRIYRDRDAYYDALRATNQGENLQVWLRFYVRTLQRAYRDALRKGDLSHVLDRVSSGCERDLLEWVLTTGTGWFQRGDYPNPNDYAGVTLSSALSSLHDRGILDKRGDRRTAEYRLSDAFLEGVLEDEVELVGDERATSE